MRTVTGQGKGAKGLKAIGVGVTALVIGAWILPSGAQMEQAPSVWSTRSRRSPRTSMPRAS